MSGSSLPSFKFPEPLTKIPRCFIALSGLDVLNNAVHRAVWDEFTTGSRRNERKPILYQNVPADHLYPKCCVHRTSYEDHVPLGILKVGWLHKHTEELPALVVFFFDLDWSDPQWEEKQMECVSKIQVIRSTLHGRATEIVIVLLQTTPPMPVGEASNVAGERAAAFCATCDLPRLNLFVLPFTHRPQGFITKIEEAFYKKAIQYYSSQIQTVKAHKEQLNKQLHQILLVRHQFKISFYTEMKQDPLGALKLYRVAYNYVVESMYLSEDRIMEFKLIAGFINYKICRLCFEADEPLNAISQFRRHIDRFSGEQGPRQLVYEHSEWMARQFSAFGDLFGEAVRRGLKAIQTQNPGVYYHHAALFAIERKRLSRKLCLDSASTASQQLPSLPELAYYGQRPWRKDLRDDQPSNMEMRQKCIVTMQAAERTVEHSWQIIPLLTKAISHFKHYHSNRMIMCLKVLMGEEYYQVKEYENSLVLLQGVIEAYRHEQWWKALSSVLQTILRCSYLLGHLQEYFTAAMELTSRYVPLPVDEKKRIQKNLTAIFSGHTPAPEPGLDSGALASASQLWEGLLQSGEPLELTVQASSHASFVECKAAFTQSSFRADSPIQLRVHLRSSAPLPLLFSKLMVLFYQEVSHWNGILFKAEKRGEELLQEYNNLCVVSERILLEPGKGESFTFTFPVSQATVRDTLEVHAVEALFGEEGVRFSTLVWSNGVSESFSSKPGDLSWQKLDTCNSTYIQPRPPAVNISFHHNSPALTSEYYTIQLSIQNMEDHPISDLQVGVALPDCLEENQPAVELYDSIPATPLAQKQGHSLDLVAGELASTAKFEKSLFLCSHGVGIRKLDVTVTYDIACKFPSGLKPVVCSCQKEESIMVQTVKPFDVTYKLMNSKFKPIDTIGFDEPFILMTEIHCTSPWQLLIVGSHFNLPKNITNIGPTDSQIDGLELGAMDRASECRCMVVARPSGQQTSTSLGTYTIQWRRLADSHSTVLTSTVTFPSIRAHFLPFTVSADIPASGTLQEVLPVMYVVHNHTILVQEFEVRIGTSDAFMYSGQRLVHFRVLPLSTHTLTYNLYPVTAGLVPLPHLDLSYQREPKANEHLMHSTLPTTILIKPSSTSRDIDTEPETVLSAHVQ